jgi:hypothetical protein
MFRLSQKKSNANFLCHLSLEGFGRSVELGITTDEVERIRKTALSVLALPQLAKLSFAAKARKVSRKVKEVPVA